MDPLAVHTLYELQILPYRPGEPSVLELINRAHTAEGKDKIKTLLCTPLAGIPQIEQRQKLLQFIAGHLAELSINVPSGYLSTAKAHLSGNLAWSSAKGWLKLYRQATWLRWFRPYDFYQLQSGTAALQLALRSIDQHSAWWRNSSQIPEDLLQLAQVLRTFFDHAQPWLTTPRSRTALLQADFYLRCLYVNQVNEVFNVFYELDAYCGIARFLQTASWTYPKFLHSIEPTFSATAITHPLLDKKVAVSNNFCLTHPRRLTLLTGGNMSGKSTFLKTIGLDVYLAHLGLPVPAESVTLSYFDKLMTSIHLSDSLELGYSHFYTELMRIKEAAEALATGQRVFLLADELFRGTNSHDAVLCAHEVINKFVKQTTSLFIISSHLPQIGAPYQPDNRVQFNYFRTDVLASKLVFTHKIEAGSIEEQTGLLLLAQTEVLASLT